MLAQHAPCDVQKVIKIKDRGAAFEALKTIEKLVHLGRKRRGDCGCDMSHQLAEGARATVVVFLGLLCERLASLRPARALPRRLPSKAPQIEPSRCHSGNARRMTEIPQGIKRRQRAK